MSDFIPDLRRDLVSAAEREQARGPAARAALEVRRVAPGRRTLARVPAVAAVAAAVALVLIALAHRPAQRVPSARLVADIHLGGDLNDVSSAAGSLWATDYNGYLVRVDPSTRQVVRLRIGGHPAAGVAEGGALWVRAGATDTRRLTDRLLRVDTSTNRVAVRGSVRSDNGPGLAMGPGAAWLPRRFAGPEGIDRLDPSTGRLTHSTPVQAVTAVAASGGAAWAETQNGTIVRIDPRSGRVVRRWPQLAPMGARTRNVNESLTADARGVWVISPARAQLIRIEGDRVVRRIAVDKTAQPILAQARDGLWIVAGGFPGEHNLLLRVDPHSGATTARLDTGPQVPVAITATRAASPR